MPRKQIVAVVGRPNVGKSTLFNALAGKRISIVEDTPGVTRDRIYQDVEWLGRVFTLIDTGGIEPDSKDVILSQMRQQAEIAIETADVIIFLCDLSFHKIAPFFFIHTHYKSRLKKRQSPFWRITSVFFDQASILSNSFENAFSSSVFSFSKYSLAILNLASLKSVRYLSVSSPYVITHVNVGGVY